MRILTEEQLKEVDRIIESTKAEHDWAYNGEDSIPTIDLDGTLQEAARRVRAYLATLGDDTKTGG